jgi:hypothetical protein
MSVASHDLFNMKLRTCIDTGPASGGSVTASAFFQLFSYKTANIMPPHGYLEGITTAIYVPSDLNRVMDVAR